MNRHDILMGTLLLGGVLLQSNVQAGQTPPQSMDYTGVLRQIREAEKKIAVDERDIYPLIAIIQGEGYPQAIREAVKRNDEAGLVELYQAKYGTHWPRTVKGTSLLAYTAMNGDADVAKQLIARGADVNAGNEEKWTPLHHAAESGSVAIVKMLLDKKADPNAPTARFLETPLMLACGRFHGGRFHSVECARLLIAKGADVNAQTSDGTTALMSAAYSGRVDTVKLLLAKGADAGHKDNKGHTALSQIVEFATFESGEVTVTQDSTSVPTYKLSVFNALVQHGKANPGFYQPGVQEQVAKTGLNDFLTILKMLREAEERAAVPRTQ